MRSPTLDMPHEPSAPLSPGSPGRPRHRRGSVVMVSLLVAFVVAGVVIALTRPFGSPKPSGPASSAYPTSTATVTERPLSSQTQVNATLGYADDFSVVNQTAGTFTALPSIGQLVSEGQVFYQVSGNPVVLLYGSTPVYRSLSEGMSGPDVEQLNADLVALGYATTSDLSAASNQFSSATATALEALQSALGVSPTGTLTLGQAVFLPTAARVTSVSATLGGSANPGQSVISATSTTRQVTIDLDASQQSEVKAGDQVTITLPNGKTTPGVISSVGTVATTPSSPSSGSGSPGSSTPTITVLVTPTNPAATGSLDQAPVQVSITTASVSHALVVPIDALLARPGGGYAVEVVKTGGRRDLVGVSLGLFDDAGGLVQVSGAGLSAGQNVVVPAL